MVRRWGPTIGLFALATLYGGSRVLVHRLGGALVLFLLFAVAALGASPWMFPRPLTDAEARSRSARDGRPIMYWRLRSSFCMRMRWALKGEGRRLHWVDIWADPAAAASVRAVADGAETVPTVVAADRALINPSPAEVRGLVRSSPS